MSERAAIVTGASRGIGLALAQAFVGLGWNLVANSRRISSAGTLAAGPKVALVDGDIALPETAARIVETASGPARAVTGWQPQTALTGR